MCGEDSLNSTNGLRLDKPKLFSFFANHSQAIKNHITQVFEQIPIYGEKKVHQQLLEDGFKISLNTVARYRTQLTVCD
jgi:DNA-directed RNA polymerase specialized sigma54-like protein